MTGNLPPISFNATSIEAMFVTRAVLGVEIPAFLSVIAVVNLFAHSSIGTKRLIINIPDSSRVLVNPLPAIFVSAPPLTKQAVFEGLRVILFSSPS